MADGELRIVTLGLREFQQRLGATVEQVREAAWRTLDIKGQQAEQRMKMLAQRNFKWRTGALAGALGYVVEDGDGGWPMLTIGAIHEPPPHLAVQEYGKVIHGNPWLTIPIEHPRNPMLTQSGGDPTGGAGGVYARDIKADPGQFGLRSTFVHEGIIFGVPASTKGGTGARFVGPPKPAVVGPISKATPDQKRAERDRIRRRAFELADEYKLIPIAVLKAQVTIPARPFMNPVWDQMQVEIPRELEAQIRYQMQVDLEAAAATAQE